MNANALLALQAAAQLGQMVQEILTEVNASGGQLSDERLKALEGKTEAARTRAFPPRG
jgi:hypothetical protein